jgi:ferredoxin like protein
MNAEGDAVGEQQKADDLPDVYVDNLLMSLKYFVDEQEAHLQIIDPDVCLACDQQPCLSFCPVGAYQRQADGRVALAFQSCVECGSCRIACPPNNVRWKYPRGGHGVAYKFG